MSELEFHRATPDRLADFLEFFDNQAFKDNPEWQSCYCQCYFLDHSKIKWGERTAQENRADAVKQVECGRAKGLLAYANGKPVAWCNMDATENLPPLREGAPGKMASLFCFIVAKEFRNQGIARKLLKAACDFLAKDGFEIIEARPKKNPNNEAEKYSGTLNMYLDAGFKIFKENPDGRVIVRKHI